MADITILPFTPIPDARSRWQTEVASVAYYGESEILKLLFKEGASPNVSHKNVISPLEAAIRGGQPDSEPSEETVEHMLRICFISGKPAENHTSPLLIDIVTYASEDTLRTHLHPGGKLASIGHEPIARAAQAQ